MAFDILIIVSWWLALVALGGVFLPLTYKLFGRFYDKGYPFAKIIAIGSISYLVWIFGEMKILSFSLFNVWIIIIISLAFNLFIIKNSVKDFLAFFRKNRRIIIFEEAVFLVILMAWSLVRGFEPRIEGLEKFMDFGFVNSILRSEYFPPEDMWLAGSPINYYYFGHLVLAVLTRISGISSSITYNLMIAAVFALVFCAVFSLASNILCACLKDARILCESFSKKIKEIKIFEIKKRYLLIGGLLSAFILTMAGNFQPFYHFFTHNGSFDGYWYPDATRFIPFTIHEFPMYSWVVSDLHGFVNDLPFVVLLLALIFTAFMDDFKISAKNKKSFVLPVTIAFILGIMYMTNLSDWMIYALFLSLAVVFKNYFQSGFSGRSIKNSFIYLAGVFILSVLFALPFILDFEPFAEGLDFVKTRSTPLQLFVLWGFYSFLAISFIVLSGRFLLRKKHWDKKIYETDKNGFLGKINAVDAFVFLMVIFSAALIILPEIIYIKDIYIASHHRANTMFKLVYQAWMLMGISSGYIIIRWLLFQRKRYLIPWLIIFIPILAGVMIYPYYATKSYYHDLKGYVGLSGLDWLQKSYFDDYMAINWIKMNIGGQPVIVEAVQDDFTHYGRVSANTGLVNIVNWTVHEWLWRGSYDEAGKRKEEVRIIYESANLEEVKSLLEKYKAKYVFVGSLEKTNYARLNENNFKELGQAVFSFGQTKIYKIGKN